MSSSEGRRPLIAANWKMHLLRADVEAFCRVLGAGLGKPSAQVVLFPSHPLLSSASWAIGAHAPGVALGGQDLHPEDHGAFTGDVAGPQLRDAGCSWVLCGHSERRRDHGETDDLVGRKVAAAERAGLIPLLCIGERREERHSGKTFSVLERQLAAGLVSRPARFAIAYEPVWAIGTGETATPEIAAETHGFLRRRLSALYGERIASQTRLVYGGSVTPVNGRALPLRRRDGSLWAGEL